MLMFKWLLYTSFILKYRAFIFKFKTNKKEQKCQSFKYKFNHHLSITFQWLSKTTLSHFETVYITVSDYEAWPSIFYHFT